VHFAIQYGFMTRLFPFRVGLDDAGPYICSADNGLGQTGKTELIVDVLYAPVVTLAARREVDEDEDVVVECGVTANPEPESVEWTKEGDDVFSQSGRVLRLNRVAAKDSGRYVCTAVNHVHPTGGVREKRRGRGAISIDVRHKPGRSFILPERPNAVEGRSVTLRCGADPPGHPIPAYRWWREGNAGKTLAVGSEFTVDTVRMATAGRYFCQPKNELGEGSIGSAFLDVYQVPKVITELQNTITKKAKDIGFQVTTLTTNFSSGLSLLNHDSLLGHL